MKIILLEQVKKLGSVGDVVNVKNGYARNFLIPNKKALRATKVNIDMFEVQKNDIEQKNEEKLANAEVVASKIIGKYVTVIQQSGEDGRLYGSVNSSDIAKSLNNKDVSKTAVNLHSPIKYVGIYDVEIDVFAGVAANIKVNVATSKEAAKEAEKLEKAASKKASTYSKKSKKTEENKENKEEGSDLAA